MSNSAVSHQVIIPVEHLMEMPSTVSWLEVFTAAQGVSKFSIILPPKAIGWPEILLIGKINRPLNLST